MLPPGRKFNPSTDGRLAIMISTKRFSVQAREARIVYLSCLSCLVILVVFFSLNLWPQFDLGSLNFTEGHSKTQHDYQSTHNTDATTNTTDDGGTLSLIPSHSITAKPAGLNGLKYAIILPIYVGSLHGKALVPSTNGLTCLASRQNIYRWPSSSSSHSCACAPTTKKSTST